MDRRAGYAQPVVDVAVTIIIIMVIVLFYILFKWTAAAREYKVIQNQETLDGSVVLYTFLREPLPEGITLAEYLQRTEIEDSEELLMKKMKEYSDTTNCPIKIIISRENLPVKILEYAMDKKCYGKAYYSSQTLPKPDGPIKFTLISGDVQTYVDPVVTAI